MSDSKYGRLFTEADVIDFAIKCQAGGIHDAREATELLADYYGTFPADEPLFLLRAQDGAAPTTLYTDPETGESGDYYERAEVAGAGADHLQAIQGSAAAMRGWQADHPERVKIPD